MEANDIGVAAMLLGAGRANKEDKIDLSVGIVLKKKIGDSVQKGEPYSPLSIRILKMFNNRQHFFRNIYLLAMKRYYHRQLIGEIITIELNM